MMSVPLCEVNGATTLMTLTLMAKYTVSNSFLPRNSVRQGNEDELSPHVLNLIDYSFSNNQPHMTMT